MSPGYYDRPVLQEPVWIWSVPVYFHFGGAAGAALVLGAAVQLSAPPGTSGLVRRCRRFAAGALAAGTGLLVVDLGRPERFLNMLRVFRPTSPLSVGSWLLAAATPLAAGAAVLEGRRAGDAAGALAGAAGLPLAGYTAVLLSQTAVPVWQATHRSLPALFVASAAASAASALETESLDEDEAGVVFRFGTAARIAALVAEEVVERDAGRVERVGRALEEGVAGSLWRTARVLTAASLALSIPGRTRPRVRRAAGIVGTLGGLLTRVAIVRAGTASARDPHATFEQQRAVAGANAP